MNAPCKEDPMDDSLSDAIKAVVASTVQVESEKVRGDRLRSALSRLNYRTVRRLRRAATTLAMDSMPSVDDQDI